MPVRPILCILAGGRSSRFGSPKLWLRVGGVPLVTWLGQRLSDVCGKRWISVAPGMELPPGAGGCDRIVADHVGFGGPLPAMVRVLSLLPCRSAVLFVAGDMPLIDANHVRKMMKHLAARRSDVGVMSQWTSGKQAGRIEPMPSLWRTGPALRMIRAAMLRGVRGPSELATWRGVSCVEIVGPCGARSFANINRPEDVAMFEKEFIDVSSSFSRGAEALRRSARSGAKPLLRG